MVEKNKLKKSEKSRDAYGHLMRDFLRGRAADEIIEREDGLLSLGRWLGPQTYFSSYEDWPPLHKIAMRYVRGRTLDIGCGAGRHSLYLQEKGFDVIGIDSSPLAIAVCRSRGLRKVRVLSISGVGEFAPARFDSVIMMGNNFGLFGSFRKAQTLLRVLHRITAPEARIVAESTSPYAVNDSLHRGYRRWNLKRGRMAGQLRFRIRHKNIIGEWMDYLLVSKREVRRIVKGTGWRISKLHDSGRAPLARYIMVLTKT
jgi:SAM-dependent methyltransferase